MSYSDSITRTNAAALIPEVVSDALLQSVTEASCVMRLARKLPNMSTATTRMPVISALPTAYFQTSDNSLAQTTSVEWANKYIYAEELTAIVPVPKNVLDDAGYPIWDQVSPLLAEALAVKFDGAVLYGTDCPSTWATALGTTSTAYAGIVARCTAASQTLSLAAYTDLYEALLGETAAGTDGVLMAIEADGFMATGHIAHTSMRGKLRNCRDSEGQPIFKSGDNIGTSFATGMLDGSPILYPLNGSIVAGSSLLISGDWSKLVYAMRRDMTIEKSDQATITDAQGKTVFNLWQQNMVAIKVSMRLGVALPNPINRMNETELTRCPFAVLTA